MAPVPPVEAPPSSLVDRATRWVEENQKLILIGAGVAAAAGAGYYLYSRSGEGKGSDGAAAPPSTGSSSSKNKKKKKTKKDKFLKGEGTTGPLLEEITPPEKKADEKVVAVDDYLEGELV